MLHVGALPGTPQNNLNIPVICQQALLEANIYRQTGFDGFLIENMHDVPYLNSSVGPEIIAGMTVISQELKKSTNLIGGIQILAAANREALAVAAVTGLDFIRVENFLFGHVADEGLMQSCAGELLRYRKLLGAENILVFTDIKKKHAAHAITGDIDIIGLARTADFFLSDGIVFTGKMTGEAPDPDEVARVRKTVQLPIIIGSGLTPANLSEYWDNADIFIVGSSCKEEGIWSNPVSQPKCEEFMIAVKKLRSR
ncbi:MAG: BtpA/SgcQ family protein [Candidatus Cloacimonetes bacterium]|nr:BtpA/SgcQ family protein [Candidatus Cloacimonadota bacterium]